MLTRRDILQQAGGMAAVLATTAPWWLVRLAHAARQTKLVVWNPAALAPQVDKIIQEQCYAYAKQAGIKEDEIDYSVGGPTTLPKLVASTRPGIPRICTRLGSGYASSIAQGHLLEVTDVVEKMQKVQGGLFPFSLSTVMYKDRAYGVPQSVSPRPWSPAWMSSTLPRSSRPRRGTSLSRSARRCRSHPNSPAMACAWGCTAIPTTILLRYDLVPQWQAGQKPITRP